MASSRFLNCFYFGDGGLGGVGASFWAPGLLGVFQYRCDGVWLYFPGIAGSVFDERVWGAVDPFLWAINFPDFPQPPFTGYPP